MSLRSYIIARLLLTVPMMLILLTAVFLVLRVLPGDPITILEGKNIPEDILALRRKELGLDQPYHIQYVNYLAALFTGDLGKTALEKISVARLLLQKLPATIELAAGSIVIAVAVGLLLGARAAYNRSSPVSSTIRVYGIAIYSVPVFFLGLILQATLANSLRLFPTFGRESTWALIQVPDVTGFVVIDSLLAFNFWAVVDALHHLILPCVTLGIYLSGVFVRITYPNMLETLGQDYVTAARARGIHERSVMYRYALRNALIPIVTLLGLQFAGLLAGAVLTETVFTWPGIGNLLFEGILKRDYSMVQGTIVIYAVLVALMSLIVDVTYAYLDPRIRY